MLRVKGHCSYFGNTGYNIYSRGFFKSLKNICSTLYVRNFSPIDGNVVTDVDQSIIDEIDGSVPPWKCKNSKICSEDINIILNETNHPSFYEKYKGIKIAYNIWDTTQQPPNFLNQLFEFDMVWVPSEWQKKMLIEQGYPPMKIFVISGGVDDNFIYEQSKQKEIKQFLIVGPWGFRKSTVEIIHAFLSAFEGNYNVELILLVDSPLCKDGMFSTEERLKYYGISDKRIKIKHFIDRDSYIKLIKSCDVFLSCSRGEGWNLPLLEALSCGIPSIFSNCGGQLEFANEYPLKVNILKEIKAFNEKETIDFTGNYYEPDFKHLEKLLHSVYNSLPEYHIQYSKMSENIRNKFSWEKSARAAMELIIPFMFKNKIKFNNFYTSTNVIESLSENEPSLNHLIFNEIFNYHVYDNIPEMKIKHGDVVVDIGAHIGIFSRYASTYGSARVISFEMNPLYFSSLKLNVRDEDDVFNCVILDKNFTKFKLENDVLVNGFDLNHFYKGNLFDKIDFLKIDVIGQEQILLTSINKEVYDTIKKISVKFYHLQQDDKTKIIEFMKTNGFNNNFNIVTDQPIQFLYFWK